MIKRYLKVACYKTLLIIITFKIQYSYLLGAAVICRINGTISGKPQMIGPG